MQIMTRQDYLSPETNCAETHQYMYEHINNNLSPALFAINKELVQVGLDLFDRLDTDYFISRRREVRSVLPISLINNLESSIFSKFCSIRTIRYDRFSGTLARCLSQWLLSRNRKGYDCVLTGGDAIRQSVSICINNLTYLGINNAYWDEAAQCIIEYMKRDGAINALFNTCDIDFISPGVWASQKLVVVSFIFGKY